MIVKIDDISKKIALRLGIKEHIIREINRSQWKFLHETMQRGDLKPFKIMCIGKFSKKLKSKTPWELIKQKISLRDLKTL